MIFTSGHNYCYTNSYTLCAISGNRGKDANYEGKYYSPLAPKLGFWKIWHSNIGKIDDIENNKYYIEEYYRQVLSKLDPLKLYNELNNNILLCYERHDEFCHRHIVAAWLELFLDIHVPEIIVDYGSIVEVKKPSYIKEYLEEFIIKELNINSIRSYYLTILSNKLKNELDNIPECDRTFIEYAIEDLEEQPKKKEKKLVN